MGTWCCSKPRSARSSRSPGRRIEQTALHNHLLPRVPDVMYMPSAVTARGEASRAVHTGLL